MNLVAIIGAGIIAALLSIILKQYKPEFGMYISLVTGIIILFVIIGALSPVIDLMGELIETAGLKKEYGAILLKSLAVCYITQLAVDACKDAGETAIGAKIDIAGKLAIVLMSLPLFKGVIEVVTKLMEM